MPDRRSFLTFLAGWAALPLAAAAASAPAVAAAPLAAGVAGEFFIVDGWVLTRADLESLHA